MTYTPGIPTATQLISNSQPLIKTNFQQLNSQFGEDHQELYDGSANGDGYHVKLTFPGQPANVPVQPVSGNTTSYVYPYVVSPATIPNLTFLNQLGNFDFSQLQTYTANYSVSNGSITGATSSTLYYAQLYGMVIIYGTLASTTHAGGNPYNFSISLPTDIDCTVKGFSLLNSAALIFSPGSSVTLLTGQNTTSISLGNILIIYQ